MITQNTGLDRQPFVQPGEAKGVTHIMTKEACPIVNGGGGGPGFFLHHHHHVSLGARFPSSVCVRLARQRLPCHGSQGSSRTSQLART